MQSERGTLNVEIDKQLLAKLDEQAQREQRYKRVVVERAITEYLERRASSTEEE